MENNLRNKKGFTLIELLIVIAIIGILASVVLVSLSNSRVKAKNAKALAIMQSVSKVAAVCILGGGTLTSGNPSAGVAGKPICVGGTETFPDLLSSTGFQYCGTDCADIYSTAYTNFRFAAYNYSSTNNMRIACGFNASLVGWWGVTDPRWNFSGTSGCAMVSM